MAPHAEILSMPRLLRVLVASLAAVLLPVALSGAAVADGGKSARTWTVQVGSESSDQAIQGMAFLPENIYVNAGDKVTWKANAAEIHTVTFLAAGQSLESTQPFNPALDANIHQQGGKSYDGQSYYNSGVMTNVSNSGFDQTKEYSLKFPDTGEFTYYCLVHGMAMKGTVHVREAGTEYPYSQSEYDHQAHKQERKILRDGEKQWEAAREHVDQADQPTVIAGTDNGTAMVMRFVHREIKIHVGDSVTFVNNGMGAPHTVTFGTEPADPFAEVGDPAGFTGGDLSSGLMPPGSWFKVTFKKAGDFDYICALHDFMGMVGTVEVRD
ncbi:plastocyanin/azurin family copper-binding protein [Pseudarthrobacter sp. O4]|uniref:plastocyanin/azurin family copper-binding protein n=1 Tax=Pseudarthrobacter sp. O4 TaxID=3418417 RepID=UPI003CF6E7BD